MVTEYRWYVVWRIGQDLQNGICGKDTVIGTWKTGDTARKHVRGMRISTLSGVFFHVHRELGWTPEKG